MTAESPSPGGDRLGAAEERLVGADRVIAVLTELANHPLGVSLDELSGILNSSKPTVHRALATLRRAGMADLAGRGVYVLGDEYLRLAFRNLAGRPETLRLEPLLEELATTFGETAHYAVLSDKDIVYRAKMDPPHGAVRLTSEVGGRNPAYRTAVGKALLSTLLNGPEQVAAWFGGVTPERKTPNTLTTPGALADDLMTARARGFAVDDEENEIGINCVAIPVYLDGASAPSGAVSVSAVRFRCGMDRLIAGVPAIREAVTRHLGARALGG